MSGLGVHVQLFFKLLRIEDRGSGYSKTVSWGNSNRNFRIFAKVVLRFGKKLFYYF